MIQGTLRTRHMRSRRSGTDSVQLSVFSSMRQQPHTSFAFVFMNKSPRRCSHLSQILSRGQKITLLLDQFSYNFDVACSYTD